MSNPKDMTKVLAEYGMLEDNYNVLDIGSGRGCFASLLSFYKINYEGIDPRKNNIYEALETLRDYPNFRFRHVDLASFMYNPKGIIEPSQWDFPFWKDGSMDSIICSSVFTHLGSIKVAHNYMYHIHRILRKRGKLYITFFRCPPNNEPSNKTNRTVYTETEIMNMLKPFEIEHTEGGFTSEYHDQWKIIGRKVNG